MSDANQAMSEQSTSRDLLVAAVAQWQAAQARTERDIEIIRRQVLHNAVAISSLSAKSGVWGAVAGLIPASIAIIYILLQR
jgi:hypothetical protein